MDFDVSKVASLAYLKLSPEQQKAFHAQFEEILDHVDQIQQIPMTDEEAKQMGMFHIQTAFYELMDRKLEEKLRTPASEKTELDQLKLSNEEALRNAPKSSGLPNELLYEVPSIIKR